MKWRRTEAGGQAAERRQREAEAPRLARVVPALNTLRLEIQERSANISRPQSVHTRHVVVASAPALFVLPCHDTQCKDGGHDVTDRILAALRAGELRFEAEHACQGAVGTAPCSRVLSYVGIAEYRP